MALFTLVFYIFVIILLYLIFFPVVLQLMARFGPLQHKNDFNREGKYFLHFTHISCKQADMLSLTFCFFSMSGAESERGAEQGTATTGYSMNTPLTLLVSCREFR